jgi:hypothetical protein
MGHSFIKRMTYYVTVYVLGHIQKQMLHLDLNKLEIIHHTKREWRQDYLIFKSYLF